jgi:predicted ABC-type ATPase
LNTPILHVLAGPNGSGRSTFAHRYLIPRRQLPFINADEIAAARWPGDEQAHAYDASRAAADARAAAIAHGESFITETVFSHPSKRDLILQAIGEGYRVELHVMLVPEDLAVLRVEHRVATGGHAVPETKIRGRYRRLYALVAQARMVAHRTTFYDNSRAKPFRTVATFDRGVATQTPAWPAWTPPELL